MPWCSTQRIQRALGRIWIGSRRRCQEGVESDAAHLGAQLIHLVLEMGQSGRHSSNDIWIVSNRASLAALPLLTDLISTASCSSIAAALRAFLVW